jgi:hypothetical protein
MTVKMTILQVVTTYGRNCGIALFASNLQEQMEKIGIEVETIASMNGDIPSGDVLLLHYHSELLTDESVRNICERSRCPVVLFAHSNGVDMLLNTVDGFVAMCPGMVGQTDKPTYVFPHPAWVPPHLEDRKNLRREFDLPQDRLVVGTNGFLKFERQFAEIVEDLLPEAYRNDWFIELITSPWLLDSPGLITRLERLHARNPNHFRFEYAFLDAVTLNRRLQACDLLWCWTKASSSPYASGVISDQYASGTRVFAADKQQHRHVLGLPNTVAGPDALAQFVDRLVVELRDGERQRHDPALVSWDNCIHGFAAFLEKIAA